MRVCTFDLETRKLAEQLAPGNKEKGWDMLRRGLGGISALAIYDSAEKWCYTYDDLEIDEIATHLESADVVVGYSSLRFDIPIVEGIAGRALSLKAHVDLFELIKTACGQHHIPMRKGENTLDAICKRTIGRGKIDHGSNIAELIRLEKWGHIFRYCMNDVRLTHDLLRHIYKENGVISVNGTFLPIDLPQPLRGT